MVRSEWTNQEIEWSTTDGRDYDGVMVAVEESPEGRILVVREARHRNWMDGDHPATGAHEVVPLKGSRMFRLSHVAHIGLCSYSRG